MTGLKWVVASILVLAGGCAAVTPNLPAITDSPTGNRDRGRVIWHDLLTDTPEESRRFYAELLGWEFERPPGGIGLDDDEAYMLIRHDGILIGGMVDANALNRETEISQWITVMSVDDIRSTVGRVADNGGEVLAPPTDVGTRGVMALIASPDQAMIALLESRDGDPAARDPVNNGWLWNELWTDNVESATRFFEGVIGLQVDDREVEGSDVSYRLLADGERPRVAVLPHPFEGELPVWVNYVRVESPAAITSRVEGLGGRIIVPAQPRTVGGSVAIIAGPSGAGIGLQTWPIEKGKSE